VPAEPGRPYLNDIEVEPVRGIVFDIQHYAIYDGPGIRTTVFFKGCPLRCTWCHNPESQRPAPEIGYIRERCQACGSCVAVCPAGALQLTDDGSPSPRPSPTLRKRAGEGGSSASTVEVVRDVRLCKACATCVAACPNGARELIGREISVADVLDAVVRDKPFYDHSGGGVTLSGGEPTTQRDFLLQLLAALKRAGLHTALETCGFFQDNLVDPLVDLVDVFLYDIKHIDPEAHRRFTGVSSERVLANFIAILGRAGSRRILPRVPVIPGFNSDLEVLEEITDFLRQAGYSGPVHLMPYNRMARTKYEKVGMGSQYTDMGDLTPSQLQAIVDRIEQRSFPVVCNH
jgi:pyruvate formate lyase activating enzyme